MNTPKSVWQTPQLSEKFLNHVRGGLPGSDLQFTVLNHIIRHWTPEPKTVLDLGCGDGILGRMILKHFPGARVIFIDFSEPMLDALRGHIGEEPRARIVLADLSKPDWMDPVRKEFPCDLVLSGIAIHHLEDVRKIALYREIHHLLADGGAFLHFDHAASASAAVETLFQEFLVDHLAAYHREQGGDKTRDQIAEEFYDRPDKEENILARVETQCNWLNEIGFSDVDIYFKVFELALFGGRKK